MDYYTPRQYNYARNLLMQLGFNDEGIMNSYLNGLAQAYGKEDYRGYFSLEESINNIKDELKLKQFRYRIRDNKDSSHQITATDLASYIFCPVSFSIKKSFEIEAPSNARSGEIGLLLHSQLRLISQMVNSEYKSDEDSIYVDPFFDVLNDSKILFSGHEKSNLIFENINEGFRGVPDYIFKDNKNEVFIVEEKFFRKRSNYKPIFFNNHKVQLISYIRNIIEYDVKYGYLIYWYYDLTSSGPRVNNVATLKIIKDEKSELLYQRALTGIKDIQINYKQDFNISNLNLKKCAACIVNKYCGHKTAKFNDVTFPYSRNYMLTKYIPRLRDKLKSYLLNNFPLSDLNARFGEIVCDYSFTISTVLCPYNEPTLILDKTHIATQVFEYFFSDETEEVWALINEWDIFEQRITMNQFTWNETNRDSWFYKPVDEQLGTREVIAKQTFLVINKTDVNYKGLFTALTSIDRINQPQPNSRVYFINPKTKVIFLFWDDSVFVGCKNIKTIKPIYEKYYDNINEFSKNEFEKRFN